MSIQNEIDRIRENVAEAYCAVEEQGGQVPTAQNSDNLAGAVRSIPAGVSQESLQEALNAKQDKLTGTAGQLVGFDENGEAVAQTVESLQGPGGGSGSQGIFYGTCSTDESTAEKVVTIPGFSLAVGVTVLVRFDNKNSAVTPALNVSNTGAKVIKRSGTSTIYQGAWATGGVVEFVYDGTYWVAVNGTVATSQYYGVTRLCTAVTNGSTTQAASAYIVKQVYDLANTKLTASVFTAFEDLLTDSGVLGVTAGGNYVAGKELGFVDSSLASTLPAYRAGRLGTLLEAAENAGSFTAFAGTLGLELSGPNAYVSALNQGSGAAVSLNDFQHLLTFDMDAFGSAQEVMTAGEEVKLTTCLHDIKPGASFGAEPRGVLLALYDGENASALAAESSTKSGFTANYSLKSCAVSVWYAGS